MKLIQYTDDGSRALVTILFDDGTYAITDVISGGRPKDDILKDAYILLRNVERVRFEGQAKDYEDLILPASKENFMEANFYDLTGKVYDQYGEIMGKEIQFEIQGTKARIENNKIIEEEVEEMTSYFIVASCGELVQKEERFIYPPAEEIENPTDALAKELTKLKIDSMKEKAVNASLGKEVTKLKLDTMRLQGGKLQ